MSNFYIDDQKISKGDIIHCRGHGSQRFLFFYVSGNKTKKWVTCIKLGKGGDGPFFSFDLKDAIIKPERKKRVSNRRGKAA
jgi:hypothetical protein